MGKPHCSNKEPVGSWDHSLLGRVNGGPAPLHHCIKLDIFKGENTPHHNLKGFAHSTAYMCQCSYSAKLKHRKL